MLLDPSWPKVSTPRAALKHIADASGRVELLPNGHSALGTLVSDKSEAPRIVWKVFLQAFLQRPWFRFHIVIVPVQEHSDDTRQP